MKQENPIYGNNININNINNGDNNNNNNNNLCFKNIGIGANIISNVQNMQNVDAVPEGEHSSCSATDSDLGDEEYVVGILIVLIK